MADIKHVSVSSLQKGKYCIIEGAPCIVSDVKISRPGKHGHAKVNLMAVGMLDGKKRNAIMPGHDMIESPVIEKRNAQVLSVTGEVANVMDSESFETFDMDIPEELKGEVVEGLTVVYWVIMDARVIKQIKSD